MDRALSLVRVLGMEGVSWIMEVLMMGRWRRDKGQVELVELSLPSATNGLRDPIKQWESTP